MVRMIIAAGLAALLTPAMSAGAQEKIQKGTAPAEVQPRAQETREGKTAHVSLNIEPPFSGKIRVPHHGRVNVRLHPKTDDNNVMDVLKDGAPVQVVGREGNFLAIVPPKGSNGCWIHAGNVAVDGDRAQVIEDHSPVRLDSKVTAPILTKLPKGTEIKIHRTHAGWHQISAPHGVQYYVHAKYVAPIEGAVATQTQPPPETIAAQTATVRSLMDEAQTAGRRAIESGQNDDFTRAVALWRKVSEESKDPIVQHSADFMAAALTHHQAVIRTNQEKVTRLESKVYAQETKLHVLEAHKARAEDPRFNWWGRLEATPFHLSHEGMFCLEDQKGKRTAIVTVTPETRPKLNGLYRAYIKVTGTSAKKSEEGLPIVQLENAVDAGQPPKQ
jgi:SH3-like domain-containing protein